MQFITLTGRIGGDAEVRHVTGNAVTSFSLACDQGYGDKKTSNWFRVSTWGKKGEGAAPYLLKGGVVTVVGELEIGEYNGKSQYNVRASDFTLPAKPATGNGGNTNTHRNQDGMGGNYRPAPDDLNDDVPFAHCDPRMEWRAR